MKRKILMSFFFALCFVLCACVQSDPSPVTDPPSDSTSQGEQSTPSPNETKPDSGEPATSPIPEQLTVELVLEWEAADALLPRLSEMSDLLRLALEECDCPVDQVTITISTAGGFTAEALSQGGVDAALLPAADFITCGEQAIPIAMSGEEICETVIALTLAKGEPDSAFVSALFHALTATSNGQEFLSLCRPGAVFASPTENGLQAVRDWLAEQESTGGHS